MGKTSIEWTDASWNPITGCTEISPGCANCYAARLAATRLRNTPQYKGLAEMHEGRYVSRERPSVNCTHWTGEVRFHPERLEEPLRWKKPRKIFVCDMGDLFHEKVSFGWVTEIFSVMKHCPQHTFQILTKRADRMNKWMTNEIIEGMVTKVPPVKNWPLPNVWMGVSVENQAMADQRIPLLLQTPAAVRWVSAEPLLEAVDLSKADSRAHNLCGYYNSETGQDRPLGLLHWVVCGGESGVNARPMHPDWARSLRDQCQAAGVPFFFKQWGAWRHNDGFYIAGNVHAEKWRVGKKKAGRLLDGREWNECPNEINEGKKSHRAPGRHDA